MPKTANLGLTGLCTFLLQGSNLAQNSKKLHIKCMCNLPIDTHPTKPFNTTLVTEKRENKGKFESI